ncbi:MAG: polysaccharide deacetylase family protein [Lewinellaceae bacterium]|nr:polysaccharide deacetylase family protein [Lewinellaceae bacterium]
MLIKPYLSKINFLIGRNPIIEKAEGPRRFIPEGYQSVVLISADFELAWAWRYAKNGGDALTMALSKARTERDNIPAIVDICETFNIPVTWLTVGHLFLESCTRENGHSHPELPRLAHFENDFWKYSGHDWFEHDPCSDCRQDPEWYCPGLIRQILDSPVPHEIGCHTFSHIDCRDGVCSPELMKAELKACKKLASEWGLALSSFVHPGHTIGNLDVLKAEGFTSFRTDYRNVLGYPRRHENGIWELQQTAEFSFRKEWTVKYHVYRYIEIIKRAIASNTACVFWFHPSFDPIVIEEIWPEVFRFIDANRDKIWVGTHGSYVDFLESNAFS